MEEVIEQLAEGGELPEEVLQMLELQKEEQAARVEALGAAVAKKRDEAVKGRASSGIENQWLEDEEAYAGVDDANRDKQAIKPLSPTGGFIDPSKSQGTVRSTVFLNITRPYVDAAAARVSDMLLPTDDRNWAIKPTPIAQLDKLLEQKPTSMAQLGMMASVQNMQDEATKRAEAAEKKIEDWLVECQWHAEMRKVIEDCARLGVGIMRGPMPAKRKRMKATGGQVQMIVETMPESRRVDPWNFYPDPACGEKIQGGAYCFEQAEFTARQLKDLKGLPGYIAEQIDRVIEEGPGKCHEKSGRLPGKIETPDADRYEVWYYYGIVDREDLEAMGVEIDDTTLEGVPAIVTLVNDTAIKAVLSPLDSGEFPYDVMPWQRKANHWAGDGVSRQIRAPQGILNAATRNMMDNAGMSAGPQIVIWRNKIVPQDGRWELSPRKVWFAKEDAEIKGVADAFASFNIDSRQAELSNIIQFAMKMAEDVTGLPMIMQGQQGKAPDTVGGMQMLFNNANSVLRRIARTFDDCITEPHIRRYYEWLMMYEEDDSLKGDFTIDARGSSALVERDIANQALIQMGNLVGNPAFELSPKKWLNELLKSQRLDPKRFEMDEEEKKAMAQRQAPPPPQVMAAQIRAQSDMQKTQMQLQAEMQQAQMESQVDMARIQKDTDRDTVYVQAEMQRAQAEYQARMAELQIKRELEMLKYANTNQVTLDKIKADLAKETMRLQTQKELAALDRTVSQVATPAVEPPGRAPNGQAFQQ